MVLMMTPSRRKGGAETSQDVGMGGELYYLMDKSHQGNSRLLMPNGRYSELF